MSACSRCGRYEVAEGAAADVHHAPLRHRHRGDAPDPAEGTPLLLAPSANTSSVR